MGDHELNSITSLRQDSSSKDSSEQVNRRNSRISIPHLAGFVFVLGFTFLVAGVVLLTLSQTHTSATKHNSAFNQTVTCVRNSTFGHGKNDTKAENICGFSSEAKLAGLESFLSEITKTQNSFTPYKSYCTKDLFQPYNPVPQRIKTITDQTKALYEELLEIKASLDVEKLKLRERRLLAIAEYKMKHFFGKPYENNYYTGAWMLGPSQRCTAEPIASLSSHVNLALYIFLTQENKTFKAAQDTMKMLPKFREGINQYKLNVQRGVASGMIRSINECAEGIDCLKGKYLNVFTHKTPEAVLSWPGVRHRIGNFVTRVNSRDLSSWIDTYGENMSDSLNDGVVQFVGVPLVNLFQYLENDHMTYCVPGNVSSGLGTRPVDHVYINGTKTSVKTNQTLNGEEKIMKGKDAYKKVLSYFTTTKYTPDEVHELGWRQLTRYYRQAVDIAKTITGQGNETEAVSEFKNRLKSYTFYINKQPFPLNESDQEAFQKCNRKTTAAIYCPQRYSTMSLWLEIVRSTMTFLQAKLLKLFHFSGDRRTIPTCPNEPVINFSPYVGVATHTPSFSNCRFAARYNLPFFVDKMGSEAMEWTTTVHEAIPGHHLQEASYQEIFKLRQAPCPGVLRPSSITAYKEGWATYAEHPLMGLDADLYKGQSLRYYGVIKSQIWRALRLVIDTSLHYKNMSRDEALTLFRQYMWDDSDITRKEISRYQAWPGQATSYMIGQLEIWRMRNESKASLGRNYDIRDFHYHVLSQGDVPLWYLDEYIKEFYVRCVLSGASNGGTERCFGDQAA